MQGVGGYRALVYVLHRNPNVLVCANAATQPLRINAVTLLNIVAHNSVAIKTAFFLSNTR
jgi:hypothetical protein